VYVGVVPPTISRLLTLHLEGGFMKDFGTWMGVLLMALLPLSVLAQDGSDTGAVDVPLLKRLRAIEVNPALAADAYKQGQGLATFCANCHGLNGNSTNDDTPNLAGQNPRYLLVQMQKFFDGRRRYQFMEGLIKAMSDEERMSVVMYFARQPVVTRPPTDAALVAAGKNYYNRICFRCHGADGKGSDTYARLAGQQMPYITLTLTRYRNRTGERIDPLMAENTRLMTDQQIRAVAAYVSSMR
jgi:cytochrome c553